MLKFHIIPLYFEYIKNGKKKWEGRPVGARMVDTTKTGDVVEIWTGPNGKDESCVLDSCIITIGQRLEFKSIEDMLEKCGVENMLPELSGDFEALKKGIETYKNLRMTSGKSENGEMIAIELIKNNSLLTE